MLTFLEWLDEAVVRFANIGEAMAKTLEFNCPEIEWVTGRFSQRSDGPDIYTDIRKIRIEDGNLKVAKFYKLSGAFRTPSIRWKSPAVFSIDAKAIQAVSDSEYDSSKGSDSVHIEAKVSMWIPPSGAGMSAEEFKSLFDKSRPAKPPEQPEDTNDTGPARLRYLLHSRWGVILSRRFGGPGRVKTLDDHYWDDKISERPGFYPELDGPVLKTPMEFATWVCKVIERTDIGGPDNDDEPETPEAPTPSAGRLVGV